MDAATEMPFLCHVRVLMIISDYIALKTALGFIGYPDLMACFHCEIIGVREKRRTVYIRKEGIPKRDHAQVVDQFSGTTPAMKEKGLREKTPVHFFLTPFVYSSHLLSLSCALC